MSTQGTGSIQSYSFEHQLLDNWGSWARGDGSPGLTSLGLWRKLGVGLVFTENDLMQADGVIASMPQAHKRVIKTVYLRRRGFKIEEIRKQAAVAYFSESLARACEEC